MEQVTVTKDNAWTVRIDHPESSYGIFCFNTHGDLFLNSDYGFYGYAWRAFGDDFKSFLAQANAEYIVNKLYMNWNNETRDAKARWKYKEKHLLNLVTAFISSLK
jgi:hypothetical protein